MINNEVWRSGAKKNIIEWNRQKWREKNEDFFGYGES